MKKIELGQTLTILANAGVLGGLLFLAFEIRQNTSEMRAAAAYSVHQDVQSQNRDIYSDPELARLVMRGEQSWASLDPVEQRRVGAFFLSQINLVDFIMGLEEEGLEDITFRLDDLLIERFTTEPGRREFIDFYFPEDREIFMRSEELYRRLVK